MQLLCSADIFITDYSSLYSDFLLYDRPIIFAKFSHKDYIKERNLQFSYDDLPGKKVSNWHELEDAIHREIVGYHALHDSHATRVRDAGAPHYYYYYYYYYYYC